MASYISIPRDLTKVKTKVFLNLTKRQLVCFGLGALVGTPIFFLLKAICADISSAVMGMMVVMIPFFLFAMYEKNGQPLEVILRQIMQTMFIRPKTRPYKTKNYYACLEKMARLKKEERKSASFSKKEKRKK